MGSQRDVEAAYQRVIHNADRGSEIPEGCEQPCLVSRYSTGSHGYAQAWDGVTVVLAHRIIWEWTEGPVPKAMTVDHRCHNKVCVERAHLRLLTNLENARRTYGRDWEEGKCIEGHGPEHWRAKGEQRKKGYCAECRRLRRASGRYVYTT